MSKSATITLNGRHYDAVSGHALHKKSPQHTTKVTVKRAHQTAQHVAKHHPEPSKTLMRHGVKRPATSPRLRVQPRLEGPSAVVITVTTDASLNRETSQRLKHAKAVPHSKLISRFATPSISNFEAPPPMLVVRPVAAPRKAQTTADVLQRAINHATSHEQPAPKRIRHHSKRRRATVAAVAAFGALGVLGLFVSHTTTVTRLQHASAEAGFSAVTPGYHAPGFRLEHVSSRSGLVAFNYLSNSDQDRSFSVVEQASTWNDAQLLAKFVQPSGQSYQTQQISGQTYYLFNNSITWVNNGLWYQVNSREALGAQQLLSVAESL